MLVVERQAVQHAAFYEASAQVIPVLLLTMLLEKRFGAEVKGSATSLSVLLWLVTAEFVALRVIYRGGAEPGDAGNIDAVIVSGGLVLAAVVLAYDRAKEMFAVMRRDQPRREWMPRAAMVAVTAVILLYAVLAR